MPNPLEIALSRMVKDVSDLQTDMRAVKLRAVRDPLNAGPTVVHTITTDGNITAIKPHVSLLPFSGTVDNLDFIENPHDGKIIALSIAESGDTITVRHHTETTGGNISLREAVGYPLSVLGDTLFFIYKDTTSKWEQIAVPEGGFTPGAHASSHQHGGSDEVATSTPAANAIVKALGTGKIDNGWLDAELAAIAGLTSAADTLPYYTGSGTAALTALTAFARSLIDDADAATARTTLELIAGGAGDIWVEKAGDTMAGNLDFASLHFIVNLPNPTADQHAATKAYVDALIQGLDVKTSARVATTANITLSGTQTIDGVAVIAGDRVLVKNQTAPAENGIYVVAAGAWSRSTDADTSADVTSGMYAFVAEGTVNADNGFVLTTNDPITLGTTSLVFTQFSGAGQVVDGLGLTKTGNTLDVNVDNSTIEIVTDTLQVKNSGITYAKIQNASANVLLGSVAGGVVSEIALTAFGRSFIDDADAAAGRSTLGLVIGTNVQAFDAELAAIAGLVSAADRLPYFTGSGTATLATFTAFSRTLIDDADAAAMRATLELGTMALATATDYVSIAGAETITGAKTFRNSILYLDDTDVAHGITTFYPTNVYGAFVEIDASAGGLAVNGVADVGTISPLWIRGILGSATPTTTVPAVTFIASKKNGTGVQALASTETAFVFDNLATRLITILGNGNTDIDAALAVDSLSASGNVTVGATLLLGSGGINFMNAGATVLTAGATDHLILTGGLSLNGVMVMDTYTFTLADDIATSFTPATVTGVLLMHSTNNSGAGLSASFRLAATVYMTSLGIGANTEVTTGALANGGGTDAKVTVSAHSDGKIYISNRLGASRTFRFVVLS